MNTNPEQAPLSETQIKDALIFSAKHVGHWDDKLTRQLFNGETKHLLIHVESLIEALQGSK